MRRRQVLRGVVVVMLAIMLAGCGSSSASKPAQPTADAKATASQSIQLTPGSSRTAEQSTSIPSRAPTPEKPHDQIAAVGPSTTWAPLPGPTPVRRSFGSFGAFLASLCEAFKTRNAAAVTAQLPNYEYNSGLRYGELGGGEGQTGDPGLMQGWLAQSTVRCLLYTAPVAGHATALTSGWPQPGGWGLIEFDTYGKQWKINDFTFGKQVDLFYAMHVAGQVYRYRG